MKDLILELFFLFKKKKLVQGLNYRIKSLDQIILFGENRIGKNSKILIAEKGQFIMNSKSWIGDNVEINPHNDTIELGFHTSVQDFSKVIGSVFIGANTLLAPNVFISSGNHNAFHKPYLSIREQDALIKNTTGSISHPVFIEEDCWLGKDCFVERGTYIGRGCIIGTGARVKGFIPPYSVVIGNNKILKKRLEFNPPYFLDNKIENTPYYYRGFFQKKNLFFYTEKNGLIILKQPATTNFKICICFQDYSFEKDLLFKVNNIVIGSEMIEKKDNKLFLSVPTEVGVFDSWFYPECLKGFLVFYIEGHQILLNSIEVLIL